MNRKVHELDQSNALVLVSRLGHTNEPQVRELDQIYFGRGVHIIADECGCCQEGDTAGKP